MKTCTKCHAALGEEQFRPSPRNKGGRASICKACHVGLTQNWRRNNPNKVRNSRLKHKFSLTSAAYDAMLSTQNGVCAICGQPETMMRRGQVVALSVDHDRTCCPTERSCGSCIRGLLCYSCNTGIARFNDNPAILQKAIQYIQKSLKGEK
jgi:hypothetical protein